MSLTSSPPPLPKWPFVLADLTFVAAAIFIGYTAPQPLAGSSIYAIVACVLAAAISGCLPFIVEYSRRQDEALDDRQRSLEGLARTVTAAAEQIGIAASGFHGIAELAQKNLKEAEALPGKVSAKFAEIEEKIDAARSDDREELERELATLRASESERLEATATKIARVAAEWAKAESTGLRHVVAAKSFIAELEEKSAGLKAIIAAIPAVPASSAAFAAPDAKTASAAPKAKRASAPNRTEEAPAGPTGEAASTEAPPAAVETGSAASPIPAESTIEGPAAVAAPAAPAPMAEGENGHAAPAASAATSTPAVATKPPRKPRAPRPPVPTVVEQPMAEPAEASVGSLPPPHSELSEERDGPPTPAAAAFTDEIPAREPAPAALLEPVAAEVAAAETEPEAGPAPAPKKKPAARKPAVELEPTLGLDLADEHEGGIAPASLSSDGATRLIVTAYIGIGNRLFIRGEGPGLSWDEGVPLQFVSIGKWRWETSSANAPVRFKLYRNDREECEVGLDLLEPGKQQELTV